MPLPRLDYGPGLQPMGTAAGFPAGLFPNLNLDGADQPMGLRMNPLFPRPEMMQPRVILIRPETKAEMDRIRQREDGKTVSPEILHDRARFNLKAEKGDMDLRLLEPYLAHHFPNQTPEERKRLDERVITLANTLPIYSSGKNLNTVGKDLDLTDQDLEKADASTRVFIASRLVRLTEHRPDLLDSLKGERPGWGRWAGSFFNDPEYVDKKDFKIIVNPGSEGSDKDAGSLYSFTNHIHIHTAALWENSKVDIGYSPVEHEMMHFLDSANNLLFFDGVPIGMTAEQQKRFAGARDRFVQKHGGYQGKGWEKANNVLQDHLKYALKDKSEFLSTTMESFLEQPEVLKALSPDLYSVYRDYLRIDPLSRGRFPSREPGQALPLVS